MLILIRHAMPAFGPDVPAQDWLLSDDGQARAARLATLLPDDAYLVASAEPKAWQTLEPAGTVRRDPRFNEVFRAEPWEGDYRKLRRAYVDGADHAGCLTDPGAFWADLDFPDALVIDLATAVVSRLSTWERSAH
jgi:broad specificity phosphatase PhoE